MPQLRQQQQQTNDDDDDDDDVEVNEHVVVVTRDDEPGENNHFESSSNLLLLHGTHNDSHADKTVATVGIMERLQPPQQQQQKKQQQQQKQEPPGCIPATITTAQEEVADVVKEEEDVVVSEPKTAGWRLPFRRSRPLVSTTNADYNHHRLVLLVLVRIVYLSTWAILGTVLRDFLARIMGRDCEQHHQQLLLQLLLLDSKQTSSSSSTTTATHDFVTPFSETVCVTSASGALFVDLPANMLGSFILALFTSSSSNKPHWPWFYQDHPLQQHDILLLAIKVGFCGSLTTFSAWNTQMVTLLDGTILPPLLPSQQQPRKPQIVPALFGYTIGILLPLASFVIGTHVRSWFLHWKNPIHVVVANHVDDNDDDDDITNHNNDNTNDNDDKGKNLQVLSSPSLPSSAMTNRQRRHRNPDLTYHTTQSTNSSVGSIVDLTNTNTNNNHHASQLGQFLYSVFAIFDPFLRGKYLPFLLVLGLFVGAFVADFVMHISFYRTLWISMLMSPPGALLRWQLGKLNTITSSSSSATRLGCAKCNYIPWGTLLVNIVGSVLSALVIALQYRLGRDDHSSSSSSSFWILPILQAIGIGFCGSLTTISTFCREVMDLSTTTTTDTASTKPYIYVFLSVVPSMILSLCVFSPIVRHVHH